VNFAQFFITRPIFAGVLSVVTIILGALALTRLPVAEYPDITPPTVQVVATFPGADAQTVSDTVAAPIEQEVNGVENMLYMSSQSTNDGVMTLTVTFKLGTNIDDAQVLVQNRVATALPKLPEEARRIGVTTVKQSPNFILLVNLISPDKSRDGLYLSNYAVLQIKDVLSRVHGVGNVTIFGATEYSIRIWLDANQISARNLTADDVVAAVREQNIQVAAGALGAPPAPTGAASQIQLTAMGRLKDVKQFEDIVIKTGEDGRVTKLKDVARIELGAQSYTQETNLNGEASAGIGIFQLPGSNSIETANSIRAAMDELAKRFPSGVDYRIDYDTTMFVKQSVSAVLHTLIEAFILVIIVVLVFLQNWRTTIIPLLAVPVSLIGTCAVMALFGFSLNNLSLFGLVLAIGIVVDDAIVVVENVERNMALGLSPLEATQKAMREVSGALIAIAIVLSAVFIPTAFISGISGQFYQQFALTIAVSTIISAFNSLTLSPALCALLLKPHGAPRDRFQKFLDFVLGWFFRAFERVFGWVLHAYTGSVKRIVRFAFLALLLYGGLLALAWLGFRIVPSGFIPPQDKGYLIAMVQLPDSASLERTREVTLHAGALVRDIPGVYSTIEIPGYSPLSGSSASNAAAVFIILDEFSKRTTPDLSANAILGAVMGKLSTVTDGMAVAFPPPPVDGVGSVGGFKIMIQDRSASGLTELQTQIQQVIAAGGETPGLAGLFTTFRANVPQIHIEIDRPKLKQMGVSLTDVFSALQIYMGSLYINDVTMFGRTYQVTAQAEASQRVDLKQIQNFKIRNSAGEMVPLGAAVGFVNTTGPDRVVRYNMFPAGEITGDTAPGFSSGQTIDSMTKLVDKLPSGFGYEWTDLTYQQILAGNTAGIVFLLAVVFVFLTLAAQYESLSLPLAIILIVPMCLFSAIWGVWLRGMDNNIFTQIGLVVLIGLACKNAILIVEFAKQLQSEGKSTVEAAVEAAQLRLRPILMTSFAFILGVVPLVISSGAGAEMRQALGTAVFFGMLGVTFFGIFFTPVFYVIIMKIFGGKKARRPATEAPASSSH